MPARAWRQEQAKAGGIEPILPSFFNGVRFGGAFVRRSDAVRNS
jgi:hypothetical protein